MVIKLPRSRESTPVAVTAFDRGTTSRDGSCHSVDSHTSEEQNWVHSHESNIRMRLPQFATILASPVCESMQPQMRARIQGLQGLRSPAEPTTPPWRGATVSAEDEPLLLTLQSAVKALLQTAQHLSMLTENASEVEVFCNTLEPVLLHKFKSRQFGIFTVHPWALVEHSEHRGDAEAEAVRLARSVGSSDAARLRAWIYVQLNQRSLRQTLSELLDDQALRGMFFTEPALLNRLECRQLLSDLLRPLGPATSSCRPVLPARRGRGPRVRRRRGRRRLSSPSRRRRGRDARLSRGHRV